MRHTVRAAALLVVGLQLLIGPVVVFGAPAASSLTIKEVDASSFPRVVVEVGIEGPMAGGTVPRESFSVEENGAPIAQFDVQAISQTAEGLAVALVIDTSGSMAGKPMEDAKAAAATFVQKSHPRDRLAVVGFGSSPTVFAPLTTDRATLLAAIGRLQATGETALYDGLSSGLQVLLSSGAARKNLIVLSDGGDTVSKNLPPAIVAKAKNGKVAIYAVALRTADYSGQALSDVALPTGGKVILATTSAGLVPFYAQLARDLQSQYRLIFESKKPKGKDIRLSVRLDNGRVRNSAEVKVPNPRAQFAGSTSKEDLFRAPDSKNSQKDSGLDVTILFISLISFMGASLLGLVVLTYVFRQPSPLQEQLSFYEQAWKRSSSRPDEEGATEGTITSALLDVVSEMAGRRGFTGLAQRKLEQAGLPLRPVEYMVFHFAAVLGTALVAFLMTRQLFLAFLGILVATAAPIAVLQFLCRRRMREFNDQLPDTLGIMAGSLRAGYSLLQAVTAVVDESRPPISLEFRRVLAEARLGLPLEEALEKMAERVGSESFSWAVMAINIQREVGGNLAEVLDILADTLRDRERVRRQIKTLTAEGRLSATILIALPFCLTFLLLATNPAYMSLLFTHVVGWMMIFLTAVFMTVGIIWVKSIVAIEV